MRLAELNPIYRFEGGQHRLVFNCPKCRKGVVSVWLRVGDPISPQHGCDKLPPDFDTITIRPSIADEGKCSATNRGCSGWHGFITNGEVQ